MVNIIHFRSLSLGILKIWLSILGMPLEMKYSYTILKFFLVPLYSKLYQILVNILKYFLFSGHIFIDATVC